MPAVLHVSQSTTDGLARYLSDVLVDQRRRGWRLGLASPPALGLEAVCSDVGATYCRWRARREPGPWVLRETQALARIITRFDPEVVHLHSSKAGLAGRLALRGHRPTIFTPHAWSFLHAGPATRRGALLWERWAARWTSTILCVSEAERLRGVRAGIRCHWDVVHNAVDLARFRPAPNPERAEVRDRFGLGDDPVAIGVGRLVEQKGFDVLLDVWPEVRRRVPAARLAVIGEGPLREELVNRLSPGVMLLGRREDVRDWLIAGDVVVQPSRWEGLSLVTLEAMACGRSIVATDVDGMREVLGHPDNEAVGAIVPVKDRVALVDALAIRLMDRDLAAREGEQARERAARFDLAHWGDHLAAVTLDTAARVG